MNETKTIANASSRFFVAHTVDRFNREWNFWSVWYRNNQGKLQQTGDEPFYLRWNAQRYANRYNAALDAMRVAQNQLPKSTEKTQSTAHFGGL